jgi:hypothetical protein
MSDEAKVKAEEAMKTSKPVDAQLTEEHLSKAAGGTDIGSISITHSSDSSSPR